MNTNEQIYARRLYLEAQAISSNDIMSGADQLVINELIAEAKDNIKSLDGDISRLQEALCNLQKRRIEGLSRIERLQVGIAPQKRVPSEILATIFVHCMDRVTLNLPPRYQTSVWKVIQVCSRWREIAIAEPALWSELVIRDSENTEENTKGVMQLAHHIFSTRGGQGMIKYIAPLINSPEKWDDLLGILSAYPSRLQNVHIKFRDFLPPHHPIPLKLDHLESIKITSQRQASHDGVVTSITDFFTSHSLRKASIYGKGLFSTWPSRILLPWPQLTDLTIGDISFPVFSIILSHCIQLVDCVVKLRGDLPRPDILPLSLQLEHLRSLTFLDMSEYTNIKHLLDLLIVPSLKILSFTSCISGEWPQDSILQLIDRSICTIEKFVTSTSALKENEIIPLMAAMSHLTDFHAHTKSYISDSTIDLIRTEFLVPRLRKLSGLRVMSLRPFMELLKSRSKNCIPKEIELTYTEAVVGIPDTHPPVDEGYYKDALLELRKDGVYYAVLPKTSSMDLSILFIYRD